jgi:phage gpG-like protein
MSAPWLSVELDDGDILAAIDRVLAFLEDPSPLMADIGTQLQGNVQARFTSKTDPEGQPWAPLSPTTRAIYESEWFKARNPAFKNGIPGSLLQRTNLMRASLAFNAGAEGLDIGFSRGTAGNKWQVSMLHEWGTATMPRRGLLVADPKTGTLGPGDQADVLRLVNNALSQLL